MTKGEAVQVIRARRMSPAAMSALIRRFNSGEPEAVFVVNALIGMEDRQLAIVEQLRSAIAAHEYANPPRSSSTTSLEEVPAPPRRTGPGWQSGD